MSCSSANACTAVGVYANSSANGPISLALVERWDGTRWAIVRTPNPSGAVGHVLNAVSCSSANACTAVGYYYNGSGSELTLAERWDGTRWAVQPTPNSSGSVGNLSGQVWDELGGVSCPSANACTAVGDYLASGLPAQASRGSSLTLAERWDGTRWAIQPTPNPSGLETSILTGVSCSSANICTAAGYSNDFYGDLHTLGERWDGSGAHVSTDWSVQSTPNPSGLAGSSLNGVSCLSVGPCTGVGYYNNSSGYQLPLAEAGGAVVVVPPPTPAEVTWSWSLPVQVDASGPFGQFHVASCPVPDQCTMIGGEGNVYTFNPKTLSSAVPLPWRPIPTFSPTGQNVFLYIACPTVSQCTALETGGTEVTFDPRAPHDTTTDVIDTPPSGYEYNQVSYLACPSPSQCTVFDQLGREVTFDPHSPGHPTPVQISPPPLTGGPIGMACPETIECVAISAAGQALVFDPQAPSVAVPVQILPRTPVFPDSGGQSVWGPQSFTCTVDQQCTLTVTGPHPGEVTFDPAAVGGDGTLPVQFVEVLPPGWDHRAYVSPLYDPTCPTTTMCLAGGSAKGTAATSYRTYGNVVMFDPYHPESATEFDVYVLTPLFACASPKVCLAMGNTGNVSVGTAS